MAAPRSARSRSPALAEAPRERRSHAERTAQTRARIIAAVVDSIAEVGFGRTTAAEVTRRSGVTWGAVQHHFGGKDGMLIAVLEDSFDRFARRLGEIPLEGTSLEERAALFIEAAWEHFSSPHFRSTFEILLNATGRSSGEEVPSWQSQMAQAWDRVWQHLFHDAPVPRRRRAILQRQVIATLVGMGSLVILEGGAGRSEELELLKEHLVRELLRTD